MSKKASLYVLLVLLLLGPSLACGAPGFTVEPMESPKLTVISFVISKMEAFGRTEVTVHLRNDSQRTVIGVKIHADCYKDGKLIATEWQPAEPRELPVGAESAGSVHFAKGVTCDDVKVRFTAFR